MSRLPYAIAGGALAAACLGVAAYAQQPAAPPFATSKVADNVTMRPIIEKNSSGWRPMMLSGTPKSSVCPRPVMAAPPSADLASERHRAIGWP